MLGFLLANTKLVTGGKKLITDATTVLTGVAALITVILVIINLIKKQNAEDEGEAIQIKKKIKSILICGICITVASGLVTVIFEYFK